MQIIENYLQIFRKYYYFCFRLNTNHSGSIESDFSGEINLLVL